MGGYEFDWSVVTQYESWIITGVELTILVSIVSMALSMLWALVVAYLRMSPLRPVRTIAAFYIAVVRAIPTLVFILWAYYGVTVVTGINIPPVQAGILVLVIQYAGWLAEVYRSGIQAVDKGQTEAAHATGMSSLQTFITVTGPQAWRIVLPAMGNMFIAMLKDSSLISVIGVGELMRETELAVALTFRPFELFTVASLIYIVLTLGLSRVVAVLENHYRTDALGKRRFKTIPTPMPTAA